MADNGTHRNIETPTSSTDRFSHRAIFPQPGPLIVYMGSNSGCMRHAKSCFYLGFDKEIGDHIAMESTPFLVTKSFLVVVEIFLSKLHNTRKNHLWLGY